MSIILLGQVITALVVIVLILLQDRSSDAGGLFGGGGGGVYQTRRGLEKIIFISTITFVGLFTIFSILNLLL